VLWKATGESYNAIVERLNSDGTYDVVYENSIQDKAGHEKNISADRIKFLEEEEEIYWTEDKKEEDGERSILTATEILKVCFILLLYFSYRLRMLKHNCCL